MRRTLPVLTLLALPVAAFALDYSISTDRYTDIPFTQEETAGISVLTNLGAVSGNPDGTFAPERTLNRAEFLKIAYLSTATLVVNEDDGDDCFPDVSKTDWFSPYVCMGKLRGDLKGYPDGLFHPERSVNYVEALKILMGVHSYSRNEPPPGEGNWYDPYLQFADQWDLELEGADPGAILTRGQTARLAASFRAWVDQELDQYRAFERGETIPSSSSSASSESSDSSSSSLASSSSSSSSSTTLSFPAVSHFVVAGMTSPILYDGILQVEENARVQAVEIEMFREILSLDTLILVDQNGAEIATLRLRTYNNANKVLWRADLTGTGYVLPGNTQLRVGIRAGSKALGSGAASNELVQFRTVQITAVGVQNGTSYTMAPSDVHQPSHQTAFGHMTGVTNTLGSTMSVQQGSQRLLGSFALTAEPAVGASVLAKNLVFELQKTDTNVSGLKIGTTLQPQQSDCATEIINEAMFVNCILPESLQSMSTTPVTLSIYGDVTVAAAKQSGTVRLASHGSGTVGQAGAVMWTDGSGTFNWMEPEYPADSGPVVTVTK